MECAPAWAATVPPTWFWAIASPETYDLLVLQRGWSPADCAAWVAGAITAALFDKPGQEQ